LNILFAQFDQSAPKAGVSVQIDVRIWWTVDS